MSFISALRWIAERLKDLLYDPTNGHLDTGRVAAWLAIVASLGAAVWNVHLRKEIDLGVTGFPAGLAALLGALQFYLYHDRKNDA